MLIENDERMHFKGCPSDKKYMQKFREFYGEKKIKNKPKQLTVTTASSVIKGVAMVRPFSAVSASPKYSESFMSLKLKGVLKLAKVGSKVSKASARNLNGIEEIEESSKDLS